MVRGESVPGYVASAARAGLDGGRLVLVGSDGAEIAVSSGAEPRAVARSARASEIDRQEVDPATGGPISASGLGLGLRGVPVASSDSTTRDDSPSSPAGGRPRSSGS